MAVEFLARANHHLGRSRWRRGANIGGEVGDGEISFVADSGNDGDGAGDDRPRDGLFVKGPQIFGRATPTGEYQHVSDLFAVEIPDGLHDFAGCALALHANRIEDDVQIGKTPLENVHDIAHGGAARRRDQPHALRQYGKRFLAFRIEQALGIEALLQLLEGELQRAQPDGLDVFNIKLVFAARFIDADRAAHGDVQAIFGPEFQARELRAKTDTADLRVIVL